MSTAGIFLVLTELKPKGMSALGITFDLDQYERVLFLLGVIVIYFWFAFVIYAVRDPILWRFAVISASRRQEIADRDFRSKQQSEVDKVREKLRREDAIVISVAMLKVEIDEKEEIYDRVIERYQRPSWLIFIIRMLFDVFLPSVVGGYAIKVLLFK